MKTEELRSKTTDQLNEQLVQLKKEQFNLRFQASSGELENVGRFREIRRTIARVMTVKNQKKKEQA